MAPRSERPQTSSRRGKRIALTLFTAIAAGFIVSSTWQVARDVFGLAPRGGTAGPNCVFAVKSYQEALDRGLSYAAAQHSKAKAEEQFENEVVTQLDAVNKHCQGPSDRQAYVAAVRLREAAEAAAEDEVANLARLRRALEARIAPR